MKRNLAILFLIMSMTGMSQIADDALRLSRQTYFGSSRFSAMGGAFTALGGDISSASLNPAGLGLYRSNDFSFTLGGDVVSSDGTYLSTTSPSNQYKTILPSFGFAFSAPNLNRLKNSEGPKSWTFAIGYNQMANFNMKYTLSGQNTTNSFLDPIVSDIADYGSQYYNVFTQTGVVFDPGFGYTNDYQNEGEYNIQQDNFVSEEGSIGEYFISGAMNWSDKLYLGMTVGLHSVYYDRIFQFTETPNTANFPLGYFEYTEHLTTTGFGINAKIGAIYSPIYWLKIGAAIHTPTSYDLVDDYKESVSSMIEGDTYSYSEIKQFPEYNIMTPLRLNFGTSFLINRIAIVSVDYELVDYSMSEISSSDNAFTSTNEDIDLYYKTAHNIRLGGEFRIGMIALRGGAFYYGSPYTANSINEDNNWLGFTGGIGFFTGQHYFDLTYGYKMNEFNYQPYRLAQGTVDSNHTTFRATFGFRF